ncbi:MAG: glycosyltransferase family 9 protein [Alphaproteobacteria bacterium]|nr:glycosyltransferase family 9 protein [Alphaproteobacteria bacterium]
MRILYITSNRLGDAILSSGVLRELHRRHLEARFTIAAGPVAAGLFEGFPALERLIPFRKTRSRGSHWLKLWAQVAPGPWDMVVDFRNSMIGYSVLRKRLLTERRPTGPVHRVPLAASVLNMENDPPAPKIWVTDAHRARAAEYFPFPDTTDAPSVVMFGPTANWQGKMWPIERFTELARRLTAPGGPYEDAYVAIIGGPGEETAATALRDALPADRRIDLFGTPLGVAAACIERADLYTGNDSGLMHMAAAVETPTVGLFGPTRDTLYAPWGPKSITVRTPESYEELAKSPIYGRHNAGTLMGGLAVDTVLAAITELRARLQSEKGPA